MHALKLLKMGFQIPFNHIRTDYYNTKLLIQNFNQKI